MSVIGGYGNPGIFRAGKLQKSTGSIIRPKMLLVFAEAAATFNILQWIIPREVVLD